MNTYVMLIHARPRKERVNISVDTAVHQRFSQFAERNSQSVSGILNDLMAIYVGPDEDDSDPFTLRPNVVQRLRALLTIAECNSLHDVVERISLGAGLAPSRDPADGPPNGDENVTEWIGSLAKRKTGVRLTFNLSHEPDTALGQSLLFPALFSAVVNQCVEPERACMGDMSAPPYGRLGHRLDSAMSMASPSEMGSGSAHGRSLSQGN